MAEKLTDRVQIAVAVAQTDLVHIVDVSDTSQDPAGSSFKGTAKQLINSYVSDGSEGALAYWDSSTSKYIPISTSGIYHDAVNNRIGMGINTGLLAKCHIKSASGTAVQVDTSTINNNFTILDTGGLVGIGKTPDTYKLDIEANDFGLRVTDNQGFGNLLKVNKSAIDLFDNQGNQVFTVYNINGSTNIKSASTTFCQDSFFIAVGTQFGGEIQHRALLTNHLALVTASSSKDIIIAVGVNEKFRVKNTEVLSQVSVGIGNSITSVNASAILQADSTTKGFLPPRMTTTQRDAISTPAEGLLIYNTTTQVFNFYNGTVWGAV